MFQPVTSRSVATAVGGGRFRFGCTGCGGCCRGPGSVYFTARDLRKVFRHLRLRPAEQVALRRRLVQGEQNGYLYHRAGGACIFLDSEERCRVYPVRPLQCRSFPFWPSSFVDEAAYAELKADCPGVDNAEGISFSSLSVARRVNSTRRRFLEPQKLSLQRFMV